MTILTNPNSAHRTVTTHVSGLDEDGIPLVIGVQQVESWRAAAAIAEGEALMFVAPTATVPMTVTPMTVAVKDSGPWRFAGVALEAAVAGEQVRVCSEGFCQIRHDAADAAAAYSLVQLPDTTTGRFAISTTTVDDLSAVGWSVGVETGATDRSLAYVNRAGVCMPDEYVP